MYKLHGFSQSGNTFKVALLLQALEQPWSAVHVPFADFMNGVTRSDAWREGTNTMGEVPVLEEGSRRMSQSAAIMLHLAQKHGKFGGASEDERQDVLRWLFFDNHKFTANFATYRFMKSFGPTAPDPGVMKFLRGRIDSAFGIVNKHLSSRDYLVGDRPTIADFSLCGYLYFPAEESGVFLTGQFPAIAAWLARIGKVPGWVAPYELLPGARIEPRW